MDSGRSKLAGVVALAYTLVIVYASLQPFSGWRAPSEEVLGFLRAPWPRYVTASDIMLNVAAYLPLGAIMFIALRPPLSAAAALIVAALSAAALSLGVEHTQMFLPARIASNLDLLTNISGAVAGALAAWLLTRPALAAHPFVTYRRRALRADALGDCGLLIVVLWIVIQFQQAPLVLGNGDLRETLDITPLFAHTPHSYLLAEMAAVALAIAAIGLLVSLLLQPRQPLLPAIAVTLLLAFAAKSIAAVAVTRAGSWLQWLTPGVAVGIGAGVASLALLLWLRPAARAMVGVFCLAAGVLIVNIAPGNPYQLTPSFMLGQEPRHLISFSHIVHTLSQAWPLIAAIYLLAMARALRAPYRPALD